jgi:cleavage and polyadenylation specificity factor subunit 1
LRLRAANGTEIPVYETERRLTVDLGLGRDYSFNFIVAAVPTPILGADFLRQHGLVPYLQSNQLIDGRTFLSSGCSSRRPADRHPDIAHVSLDSNSPPPDGPQFAEIRRSPQFQQLCVPPIGFPTVKTPGVVHRIFTRGNPVHSRPRRLLPEKLTAAKKELELLLERGILEPSSSEWASPIHLVKKPGNVGYRMVGCYERLNAITVPDRYPVPDVQTFTDQLDGATIFSTVDLARAFAQIPVREIDRPKTAITTPFGLYQYTRMPFGLCNAAQSFQRLMDTVLRGMPRVFAYIDDILLFSPDPATHRSDLEDLFDRLAKHGLVVRPEKCVFGQEKVRFLGLEVSPTGVRPTPDKVDDLLKMPPPRSITELRRFIGMINFYHRFVPHLAGVLRPLHDLVNKRKREFHWSAEHATAYDLAKSGLASASLLAFPRSNVVTQVAADASDDAVGAVIQQYQAGRWVPIAYHSRKMSTSQLKWSTGDKELFALFSAVKRFQHLLEGRPNLQLLTDHKPLVFAFTSTRLPAVLLE